MPTVEISDGHGYVAKREEEYLEERYEETGDLTVVAKTAAENAVTYQAEFIDQKTLIAFGYTVSPDGRWTNSGKTLEQLVDPDGAGGERINRVLAAEQRMITDASIEQAVVISEDIGYGRSYIYLYTDRGDTVEALAIEYQGSTDDLQRMQRLLAEKSTSNHDSSAHPVHFSVPLFYERQLGVQDILSAIEQSYESTAAKYAANTYLSRIRQDVEHFPRVIQTQQEQVDALIVEFERQILANETVQQGLSAFVRGTIVRLEQHDAEKPRRESGGLLHERFQETGRLAHSRNETLVDADLFLQPQTHDTENESYRPYIRRTDSVSNIPAAADTGVKDQGRNKVSVQTAEVGSIAAMRIVIPAQGGLDENSTRLVHNSQERVKNTIIGLTNIAKKLPVYWNRVHRLFTDDQQTIPHEVLPVRKYQGSRVLTRSEESKKELAAASRILEAVEHDSTIPVLRDSAVFSFLHRDVPVSNLGLFATLRVGSRMRIDHDGHNDRTNRIAVSGDLPKLGERVPHLRRVIQIFWERVMVLKPSRAPGVVVDNSDTRITEAHPTLSDKGEQSTHVVRPDIHQRSELAVLKTAFDVVSVLTARLNTHDAMHATDVLYIGAYQQENTVMPEFIYLGRFYQSWLIWKILRTFEKYKAATMPVVDSRDGVQYKMYGYERGLDSTVNQPHVFPWLLLAIIWYMTMKREQGRSVSPLTNTKTIKKKSLPKSGIVVYFPLTAVA